MGHGREEPCYRALIKAALIARNQNWTRVHSNEEVQLYYKAGINSEFPPGDSQGT